MRLALIGYGKMGRMLEQLAPGRAVDLHVGFAPDGLAAVAQRALAAVAPAPFEGNMMLRLNDPLGFLRSIRAWLAVHRPPDARSVSIRVTDADVTASIEWRAFGVAIGTRELPEHVDQYPGVIPAEFLDLLTRPLDADAGRTLGVVGVAGDLRQVPQVALAGAGAVQRTFE